MSKQNENRKCYKKTKVGWIPEEWDCVQIGDIAKVSSGGTPSRKNREYWGKEIPWVKTAQINNSYIYDSNIDEWITRLGLEKSSARMISAETILMAMYGQGKTRGQVAILKLEAAINQACAAILLNKEVNRNFIFQQFLYRYYTIRNLSNDGSQKNLNASLIRSISIPLPTLDQQNYITTILSVWDRAIEQLGKLIVAKEKRYRWLLNELINKASAQHGWKKVRLGEVFKEVTEKVCGKDIPPFSISAGIGFVSQREKWGKDIAGKQYQNYVLLQKGEFAYNKGNSKKYTCGCIYLLEDFNEIAVPNVFISFKRKNKTICSEFYEHYFIANYPAPELRKYITSSARSDGLLNLNKKDFFKILIPFPPSHKQKLIANVLTVTQREISILNKLTEKYKKQKKGLMQKLLTGNIRVKVLIKEKIRHGSSEKRK